MPADLVLAGVGIALIALAVAWRRHAHRSVRTTLAAALASPDPAERRAAVGVIAEHGVAANAELLLDHACNEEDPEVLAAIALAVARSQWEPLDNPTVVELRLWAQRFNAAWRSSQP